MKLTTRALCPVLAGTDKRPGTFTAFVELIKRYNHKRISKTVANRVDHVGKLTSKEHSQQDEMNELTY